MTAKEWLSRAWHIDREITKLTRERDAARERCLSTTPAYEGDPVTSTKDPHTKFEALAGFEMTIDAKIDELYTVKREILESIYQLPNGSFRTVLVERYLEFHTWEQIAVDMEYSWRQVIRIHGEALLKIKDVIECHTDSVI